MIIERIFEQVVKMLIPLANLSKKLLSLSNSSILKFDSMQIKEFEYFWSAILIAW